jgi:hypothetical protein
VDKRFDDSRSEISELIRLAQRGHVFSAAAGEIETSGRETMFRTAACGPEPH